MSLPELCLTGFVGLQLSSPPNGWLVWPLDVLSSAGCAGSICFVPMSQLVVPKKRNFLWDNPRLQAPAACTILHLVSHGAFKPCCSRGPM